MNEEIAELKQKLAEARMGLEHIRDFRISEEQPDRVGASNEMRVLARAYLEKLVHGQKRPSDA